MLQSMVLANKTTLTSDFLHETVWNLLDNTFTIPKISDYVFYEVNEDKYIGRPDLLSLDAYNDTMYADVICKLNGISNPFELNKGMMLILPAADEIMHFTHSTPTREIESNLSKDGDIPVLTLSKKANRKPNQSIVNNKRFKIDKNKGIIIY